MEGSNKLRILVTFLAAFLAAGITYITNMPAVPATVFLLTVFKAAQVYLEEKGLLNFAPKN